MDSNDRKTGDLGNATPVLISACLFGLPCRYDAASRPAPSVPERFRDIPLVPICPEQLGGLPTPRPPCDLSGGDGSAVLRGKARVLEREGKAERTDAYIAGARRAVEIARLCGAKRAVLKSKSPSCGVHACYQDGELVPGPGVAAAALQSAGIQTEEWDA